MKKICYFVLLFLFSTLLFNCSPSLPLTPGDREFIMTGEELFNDMSGYEYVSSRNGIHYLFIKSINHLGFYSMYSIRLQNKAGSMVKIRVMANKFYLKQKTIELLEINAKIKAFHKDAIVPFNPRDYDGDDGFFIIDDDYFTLHIMKGTCLYSITIEGTYDLSNISDFQELLIRKMENLAGIPLEKKE